MRPVRATVAAALLLCACGCSTRLGEVGAMVTEAAYPPVMVLATGTTGEDCGTSILFLAGREPRLETALERAVSTVPEATLLTGVQVERFAWTTGVYTRSCLRVRGSAAKLISRIVLPAPEGHHGSHSGHH